MVGVDGGQEISFEVPHKDARVSGGTHDELAWRQETNGNNIKHKTSLWVGVGGLFCPLLLSGLDGPNTEEYFFFKY